MKLGTRVGLGRGPGHIVLDRDPAAPSPKGAQPPIFGQHLLWHCTLGPCLNSSGYDFLCEVGRRLSVVSGDPRETSFLFQRLSILIQRFNPLTGNRG